MTITEKVSYLKGLAEGLKLDETTKEGQILKVMIEALEDIALTVSDLEDNVAELGEYVESIDDDLSEVEEELFGDEDDYDDEDDDEDEDDQYYEVECPTCREVIYLDQELADKDEIKCPNCGEKLELDFSECECDDDCDCGCHHE